MRCRTVALVLLAVEAGCLWRGYATILSVHLDVLTQTASKLCAVVEARRGPSAEAMAEYVYPAQRGRQFLSQFSRYEARPSYQQFRTFLDDYERMVREVDADRAAGRAGPAILLRLTAERDALEQAAAEIRSALKQEGCSGRPHCRSCDRCTTELWWLSRWPRGPRSARESKFAG